MGNIYCSLTLITRVEEKKYLLQNIDYRDEEVMNNLDKDWLKCDSFNKKVAGRTFNVVTKLQGVVCDTSFYPQLFS